MKYEKDLMASWDEYAIKKTIEHDRKEAMEKGMEKGMEEGIKKGREEGMEEGIGKKTYEFVKNLLLSGELTVVKIANFANVSEVFVGRVKKEIM